MNLTMEIETSATPNAFLLCRRGALNRKVSSISFDLRLLSDFGENSPLIQALSEHGSPERSDLPRQVGALSQALADLNAAIELEPLMLDAYWHRHLLYLLQNRLYDCLDDLNLLLKHQRTNSAAYKSR